MPDKDWRATVEFTETATGRLFDTTFCVRDHVTSPAENLAGATVAADLSSWLITAAAAMTFSGVKVTRFLVNRGGPWGPGEGDPQESGELGVDTVGSLSSGTGNLPHGACARVTLRTNLASRRGRGRFHAPWPGYASYLSSADTWNTAGAYYTNVAAFAALLAAGHDATHDLIVHHYSLRVHSRVDATTRDVTTAIPRTQVSYLRSRLSAP